MPRRTNGTSGTNGTNEASEVAREATRDAPAPEVAHPEPEPEPETFECSGCGADVPVDECCENCARCENCGNATPREDTWTVRTGRTRYGRAIEECWCEYCRDNSSETCYVCDTLLGDDALAAAIRPHDADRVYCAECAVDNLSHCGDCDEWYAYNCNCSNDDSGDDDDDEEDNGCNCQTCRDARAWQRASVAQGDNRERIARNVQSRARSWRGFSFESVPSDDMYRRNLDGVLHDYSYKPHPVFMAAPNRVERNGISRIIPDASDTLGIELEVGTNRSGDGREALVRMVAQECKRLGIAAYIKSDGSLYGCNGFEIVTHPYTRAALARDRVKFCKLLVAMSRARMDSHNNGKCGLHVHIGRTAFRAASHEYRFVRLFVENETFWQSISRRTDESWNEWCKLPGSKKHALKWATGEIEFRGGSSATEPWAENSHYHGLNLTNEKTIEVRVFRGTLRPESFFGAIETICAAADYTRGCGFDATTVDAFLDYIETNAFLYPAAASYLRRFVPNRFRSLPVASREIVSTPVEAQLPTIDNGCAV